MAISHVDAQIKNLWGPLYAGAIANEGAWQTLKQRWRDQFKVEIEAEGNDYLKGRPRRKVWIGYNRDVFQPTNQRMVTAIFENTHLFEVDNSFEIPLEIIDFIEHVECWRAVTSQWDDTDFDVLKAEWFELEANSAWNDKFLNFAQSNYESCINRKAALLKELDDWRFFSTTTANVR